MGRILYEYHITTNSDNYKTYTAIFVKEFNKHTHKNLEKLIPKFKIKVVFKTFENQSASNTQ